jgi:hypothetical protein
MVSLACSVDWRDFIDRRLVWVVCRSRQGNENCGGRAVGKFRCGGKCWDSGVVNAVKLALLAENGK